MIVGTGDIAKVLIEAGVDRDDVIYFASGVSDSRETKDENFRREVNRLHRLPFSASVVYFSSLCIYYSDSNYANHKRAMENRIKAEFKSYTIIRLGNIAWGSNPNTIVNYFKHCHGKGSQPELQDTYRYLITKDEFIHWVKMIRVGISDTMNLPGEMVHVKEIWRRVTNGEY